MAKRKSDSSKGSFRKKADRTMQQEARDNELLDSVLLLREQQGMMIAAEEANRLRITQEANDEIIALMSMVTGVLPQLKTSESMSPPGACISQGAPESATTEHYLIFGIYLQCSSQLLDP